MDDPLCQLFVYGTLIPGAERWPFLEPFVTSVEPDSTRGLLFATPYGYPAARFDGTATIDARIQGLVLALDPDTIDECLAITDRLEGTVAGVYHRLVVDTDGGQTAWSYQYGFGIEQLEPIPSGSWAQYLDLDPDHEAAQNEAQVPASSATTGAKSSYSSAPTTM